jgi:hypothetical protein
VGYFCRTTLAILAVLAGADGWTAIKTYDQAEVEWLRQFLELPNGIPSHDTIARVFSRPRPTSIVQMLSQLDCIDYSGVGSTGDTH